MATRRSKRGKLAAALEDTAEDPRLQAAAAGVVAAGGAAITGKLLRDRVAASARKRARRYRLEPEESPREGIARISRGQLDLAIRLLERPGRNGHADAVHEARKALKRVRAALRLSRGAIGRERYRQENNALRDVGRTLSDTRDAQVLLETIDDLGRDYPDALPWPRLREALSASAEAAAARDGRPEAVGSLSDARVRVATWPLPDGDGPGALLPGLERIYRRGRRAFKAARKEPTTENLHELRKRAKDLWHASQLMRPAAPKRMRKLAKRAHRLSDLLGDDHDLAVLLERAGPDVLAEPEREALATLVARRRSSLQREALHRAARLYRRKPGKLARALTS